MTAHEHNQLQVVDCRRGMRGPPAATIRPSALVARMTLLLDVEEVGRKLAPCLAGGATPLRIAPLGFRAGSALPAVGIVSPPCGVVEDSPIWRRRRRRVLENGWAIYIKRGLRGQV